MQHDGSSLGFLLPVSSLQACPAAISFSTLQGTAYPQTMLDGSREGWESKSFWARCNAQANFWMMTTVVSSLEPNNNNNNNISSLIGECAPHNPSPLSASCLVRGVGGRSDIFLAEISVDLMWVKIHRIPGIQKDLVAVQRVYQVGRIALLDLSSA